MLTTYFFISNRSSTVASPQVQDTFTPHVNPLTEPLEETSLQLISVLFPCAPKRSQRGVVRRRMSGPERQICPRKSCRQVELLCSGQRFFFKRKRTGHHWPIFSGLPRFGFRPNRGEVADGGTFRPAEHAPRVLSPRMPRQCSGPCISTHTATQIRSFC